MRIYSAGEAIGPAWEHAKGLLWQQRNWKWLLKICFVALFAELGGLNFNGSFGRHHGATPVPAAAAAVLATVGVVLALITLVISLVLMYVGSRLQFVLFDMLVLRDPMIAPAWARHGRHTLRWIGVKLTAALAIGLVLSPLLVPAFGAFFALTRQISLSGKAGQTPHVIHPPVLTIVLLGLEVGAAILLFVMLLRFFNMIALPPLALEDLSYTATFRRAWQIFRSDVGGMLLFAVLQPLLMLGLGIAAMIAVLVAIVAATLPIVLVGALLWLAVHKIAVVGNALIGVYAFVCLIALFVWACVCYLVAVGSLYTFARAWALYFVAGRYPLLGQYLEPSAIQEPWTPPPPSPEEDDDSGPGLPMDPALA